MNTFFPDLKPPPNEPNSKDAPSEMIDDVFYN